MSVSKLLVVDDDPALLKALRIGLSARGHEVVTARSGEDGLTQAAVAAPDVVVLDLGLPGIDGIEVCKRLRQWTDVPIIVLSAAGAESSKVEALDTGADDYVTKPFGMAELEARLRVALRRRSSPTTVDAAEIDAGRLHVDLVHHTAYLGGQELELTAREFDLLAFLARHAGKICTHRTILRQVWGPGYGNEAHYLRVYMHRLRRKLGEAGAAMLRTDPGVGYRLVNEDLNGEPAPPAPREPR